MEDLETTTSPTLHLALTPEGYARMQAELEDLTANRRHEIAQRLRESKDHGEFSEDNSELDEVKFEQAIVESRIAELKGIFASAHVLNPSEVPTSHVGFGSYVTLQDKDHNIEFEIRLVSSVEANPEDDLVSNESPLGIAAMGAKAGDEVRFDAPAGRITYKILKIRK